MEGGWVGGRLEGLDAGEGGMDGGSGGGICGMLEGGAEGGGIGGQAISESPLPSRSSEPPSSRGQVGGAAWRTGPAEHGPPRRVSGGERPAVCVCGKGGGEGAPSSAPPPALSRRIDMRRQCQHRCSFDKVGQNIPA